jgi:hypothetical protein
MSPILVLLDEMRGRLGMFLGSTSLTKLAAFLRGFEYALYGEKSDRFLAEFRDWVLRRFQDTSRSWEEAIICRSNDEHEAVRLFWELLDEYRNEQPVGSPDMYTFIAGNALKSNQTFDVRCNCGGIAPITPPTATDTVICPRCSSSIRIVVLPGDPGYLLGKNPSTGKEFLIYPQGSSAAPPSTLSEAERERIISEMKDAIDQKETAHAAEAGVGRLASGSESHLAVA